MKIKFLNSAAASMPPEKTTEGAAAYDLYVPQDVIIEKGRQVVKLGFCMELDKGLAAEIHPRSGYASKGMEGYEIISKTAEQRFNMNGTVELVTQGNYASLESSRFDADVIYGLIDEDFRGEVGVIINNRANSKFLIKKGTRIAQMLIVPIINVEIEEVDELTPTERGDGGFGHTNEIK